MGRVSACCCCRTPGIASLVQSAFFALANRSWPPHSPESKDLGTKYHNAYKVLWYIPGCSGAGLPRVSGPIYSGLPVHWPNSLVCLCHSSAQQPRPMQYMLFLAYLDLDSVRARYLISDGGRHGLAEKATYANRA